MSAVANASVANAGVAIASSLAIAAAAIAAPIAMGPSAGPNAAAALVFVAPWRDAAKVIGAAGGVALASRAPWFVGVALPGEDFAARAAAEGALKVLDGTKGVKWLCG